MPDTGWMLATVVTTDNGLVDWHATAPFDLQEVLESEDDNLAIHEDDSQHYIKLSGFVVIDTGLAPVLPTGAVPTGVEIISIPVWFPEASGGGGE